jgi:hypothetical protein
MLAALSNLLPPTSVSTTTTSTSNMASAHLPPRYGTLRCHTAQNSNTIFFIPVAALAKGRKAMYLRVVSVYQPEKKNPRRVHWTVGGDRAVYPGDMSTQTADHTMVKIRINNVLSTPQPN